MSLRCCEFGDGSESKMTPEEVVRAEMAAWGRNDVDEVMSYFAENAALHAGPYAPVLGHDVIRKTVEGYFSGGTCVGHEILFAIPHMGFARWQIRKSPPGVNTSLPRATR